MLLVAAGGVVGTLAAPFVLDGFLRLSPVALPAYLRVEPDPTALLIALGVLGVIGVFAGLVPALVGSRVQPADVLREGGRGQVGGRTERRWGTWLIAAEAALTLMLLVTGGLLLRSWQQLEHTSLGYRTDGIARLAITVSRQDARDEAALAALYERMRSSVGQYPGVDAVGLVWPTLPPWDGYRAHVRYPGLDPRVAEVGREVGGHVADAGLLSMLGVSIVAGRNLQASRRSRHSRRPRQPCACRPVGRYRRRAGTRDHDRARSRHQPSLRIVPHRRRGRERGLRRAR